MPKVYYINGRVVTVLEGGVVKVLTTPNDFSFQVVTDIHSQIDIFSNVCQAMIDNLGGSPGDFVFATGDSTASNYSATIMPYQLKIEAVRNVINSKFSSNYPFYWTVGNHDISDIQADIAGVVYLEKNSIGWLRDEYNDIVETEIFGRESTGWKWYRAETAYPPDVSLKKWYDAVYVEEDVNWHVDQIGLVGFGTVYTPNETTNHAPAINCVDCPVSSTTIAWCFRKEFTLSSEQLSSIDFRLETLYDDGACVYINGQLVRNYNMAAGAPSYNTTASNNVGNSGAENKYVGLIYSSFTLSATEKGYLVEGANVIAIEVHKYEASSADMYCDAALYCSASQSVPRDALSIRKNMNSVSTGVGKETTYAFVHEGCLFVNINFNYNGTADDGGISIPWVTYTWLCNLLQNNQLPTFVFGHYPFIDSEYHSDIGSGTSDKFWKLLEDHKCVIAYFCGHEHTYKKSQPNIANSKIWHIRNSPAGGNPRYSPKGAYETGSEDYTNQGFSFMDVSINHSRQQVTFSRWVSKSENASGAFVKDETWSQDIVSCSVPTCESSSSSSTSSTSSSSSAHGSPGGFFFLNEITEEDINLLYAKYDLATLFEGMTSSEKEDKIIEMVSSGLISAEEALSIAIRENLDVGA